MKKVFFILVFTFLFLGCKPIIVNHEVKNATATNLELGNIGLPGRSLLEYKFKTTAIPMLQDRIRIEVEQANFNKGKFNTYLKASPENKSGIVYIDSLKKKPKFIELKIIDRVGLLTSINNDVEVLNYLKNAQESIKIITSLSISLNNSLLDTITTAESLFLIYEEKLKKHQILAINKNGKESIINFGEGTAFTYGVSSFCWQENKRKQIVLATIIDSWNSCPSKTYKKASKANKKVNYYKL